MTGVRAVVSVLLACLAVSRPALAVDMTGLWHLHYVFPTGEQNVDRTFTQSGSMLTTDDGFSGTIDVSTGVFSLTGTPEESPCAGFIPTLSGQVDASDTIFGGIQTVGVPLPLPPLPPMCGAVSLTVTGSRTACGNGTVDPGEECDDASSPVASPSCCTDTCTLKPAGTQCTSNQATSGGPCDADDFCDGTSPACPDLKVPDGTPCGGNPCSVGGTCSAGACIGLTKLPAGTDCSLPGQTTMCTTRLCDSFGSCSFAANIQNGCHRPATGKSSIAITAVAGDNTRDKLTWTWAGGAIDPGAFGHPDLGNDYTLCLSDTEFAIPHLLVSATAPNGPSWHPTASGFKYNSRELTPDGIGAISLKSGPGANLRVRGRGALLGLPSTLMGVGVPIVVQLKSEDGTCFETDFDTPKVNTLKSFRAKGG